MEKKYILPCDTPLRPFPGLWRKEPIFFSFFFSGLLYGNEREERQQERF